MIETNCYQKMIIISYEKMIETNCYQKMIETIVIKRLLPNLDCFLMLNKPSGEGCLVVTDLQKSNLNNTDTNFNQKGMPTGGETKRQKDTLMIKYLLPVLTSQDC